MWSRGCNSKLNERNMFFFLEIYYDVVPVRLRLFHISQTREDVVRPWPKAYCWTGAQARVYRTNRGRITASTEDAHGDYNGGESEDMERLEFV